MLSPVLLALLCQVAPARTLEPPRKPITLLIPQGTDPRVVELTEQILKNHTDLAPRKVHAQTELERCKKGQFRGLLLHLRERPPGWLAVHLQAELYRCGQDPRPWPFTIEAADLEPAGRQLLGSLQFLLQDDGHLGPWGTIDLLVSESGFGVALNHRSMGSTAQGRTRLLRVPPGENRLTLGGKSRYDRYTAQLNVPANEVVLHEVVPERRTPFVYTLRSGLFWGGLAVGLSGIVPVAYHAKNGSTSAASFTAGLGMMSTGLVWAFTTWLFGPPSRFPFTELICGAVAGATTVVTSLMITRRQDDPAPMAP